MSNNQEQGSELAKSIYQEVLRDNANIAHIALSTIAAGSFLCGVDPSLVVGTTATIMTIVEADMRLNPLQE